MKYGLIRGVLTIAVLSILDIGTAAPAQAQKVVGYYELCLGQGFAEQATAIAAAGHTPLNLADLTAADLAGIDVAFITNCNNSGYSSGEYLANLPAITAAIDAGLVLVFHDRSVTNAAANIPGAGSIEFARELTGSLCNYIDVFDDTTLATNGPGGVIDDGFLDFGRCSFHGTATQGTLPSGATAILLRATHPINDARRSTTDQVVTFSYPFGNGHVVYSSIPLDFFLQGGGPARVTNIRMQTVYAPNVIAYAASLADGVKTSAPEPFLLYDVDVADRDDDDDDDERGHRHYDDENHIVSLSHRFDGVDETGWYEVEEPERFGNPVEVGFGEDVSAVGVSETYMVAYDVDRLRGQPKAQRLTGVVVVNRFGEISLDTKKPKVLLVPSLMSSIAPISEESVADLAAVDSFMCYDVKLTKGMPKFERFQVSVLDEFNQPTLLDVKKPRWLCKPVSTYGAEAVNPDNHLLCYKVKRAKGETKFAKVRGIYTDNQFTPLELEAEREKELCVPSEIDLTGAVLVQRHDDDDDEKRNRKRRDRDDDDDD